MHSDQLSGSIHKGICVKTTVIFAKSVGNLLVCEETGVVYVPFSLFHPLEAALI